MINTLKIIKKSMKRHYELVCRRRVEFLSDIFPDLVKEEDDSFTENITLNDDKNADEYSINFVFDNSLKPDYYFTALKYFGEGKDFSFLIWQDFQQFIFEWLLFEEFCVREPIKENGCINIETTKKIGRMGFIKCVWLLKKFSPKRIVGIKALRELEYLVCKSNASKGIIVTTSKLSKPALDFIEKNPCKFDYIDGQSLENIFQNFRKDIDSKMDLADNDLPF